MNIDEINSKSYWEQRFKSDWNDLGGPSQSRFFARIALANMPDWLIHEIRVNRATVCDWGCAEGSGTSELAAGLSVHVTGVDFSEEAIVNASATYGYLEFLCRNVLSEPMPTYDMVFSSNTLEHFQEPWKVFDKLSEFARSHMVMLLPFEEYQRISEHFHTFDAKDMAFARNGFVLTHAAVEDLADDGSQYWNGKQILVVYTRIEALSHNAITLANIRIDGQSPATLHANGGLRQLIQAQTRIEILDERTKALEYEVAKEREKTFAAVQRETRSQAIIDERGGALANAINACSALEEELASTTRMRCGLEAELRTVSESANTMRRQSEKLGEELEQERTIRAAMVADLASARADRAAYSQALDQASVQLGVVSDQLAKQTSSLSWRITRPMRFVRALFKGPRAQRRELAYSAMRSSYWRLPESMRHRLMRLRERFVRNHADSINGERNSVFEAASTFDWIGLANSATKFAIVPCAFEFDELVNQRPINLAKFLAEHGYKVIFVAWQWRRGEVLPRSGSEVYPGVWQIGLYDLADRVASLEPRRDSESLFIVTLPAPILVRMHESMRARALAVVYDILDEWEEFSKVGQAPWFDGASEREIVLAADVVTAVSVPLAAKFSDLRGDIRIIGNGYKPDILGLDRAQCASGVRGPTNPIRIGYFGHLTDSWFDWGLVLAAARAMSDAEFELIGYGEPEWARRTVDDMPNVTLLGKVPPARLWEHAQHWHVALVPFMPGPLAAAVDPIKIYEYLYFGLPTVCTGIPHLAGLPAVRVVEGVPKFVDACRELAQVELNYQEIELSLARATWNARFDALLQAITDGAGIRSLYVT